MACTDPHEIEEMKSELMGVVDKDTMINNSELEIELTLTEHELEVILDSVVEHRTREKDFLAEDPQDPIRQLVYDDINRAFLKLMKIRARHNRKHHTINGKIK